MDRLKTMTSSASQTGGTGIPAMGELGSSEDIATVSIRVPEAAARYPGCDSKGPFHNALQAKMSIPFSVAAVLARCALEEDNYRHIDDPKILRLVERTDLQSELGLTNAFPAAQGAELFVGLRNGNTIHQRLDNVIAATPEEIRARFRQAASDVIGDRRARHLEELVDNCTSLPDSGVIAAHCRLEPAEQRLRPAS